MVALRYLKDVVTLALDKSKCRGCGVCVDVCPHQILAMNHKTVRILDRDGCMECGACARNCVTGAITVQAGVGCVSAIIMGALRGSEPNCDCTGGSDCC